MSVTARVTTESLGRGRHWRIGTALFGLLIASVATLVFATNSLSVRAEPLPAFAARGIDEPHIDPPVPDVPDVIHVADLPVERAPAVPAPSTPQPIAGASAPRPAALIQDGAAKPAAALPRAASILRHGAGRGPAAPQPPRHDTNVALSDFGGRR